MKCIGGQRTWCNSRGRMIVLNSNDNVSDGWNIILSNKFECGLLLVIELKHQIFGFIEPSQDLLNYSSNRLKYQFFWTSYRLEQVLILIIEIKHLTFGIKQPNFEHTSTPITRQCRKLNFVWIWIGYQILL